MSFDDDWNLVTLLKIPKKEIRINVSNNVTLNKNLIERFSVSKQLTIKKFSLYTASS